MHELSVCQAMLTQVEEIAQREHAAQVTRILIHIGPLSGVVPELLQQAFTVARAGSVAANADLDTELQSIRIRCQQCGAECDTVANRLICCECGDFRTQLISGDELLLARVELIRDPEVEGTGDN
ncbi:MAG: hydrogenase maturation nickel metallochaperone HypA [Candidatus Thiodiazotropha sp. (ex Codakia rugifera)]|nr:hydrogenase maturation nickel metallochaperone HypA [Candidatus Thiodiazotropha sp. (ex Codakia rugifera)]